MPLERALGFYVKELCTYNIVTMKDSITIYTHGYLGEKEQSVGIYFEYAASIISGTYIADTFEVNTPIIAPIYQEKDMSKFLMVSF